MTTAQTISDLLQAGQDHDPAILAPDRDPLTYGRLRALVRETGASLAAAGIGRGDRIAIVLPNGPEMAMAFVAIAACATAAPLNPAYRQEEYDFYLSDLNARALIVLDGSDSPAVAAAGARNIPVVPLVPDPAGPAGCFTLSIAENGAATAGLVTADDVALVLHTSGTTSRPKIVPLSQRNVAASAGNIAESLKLTAADRCLNIMPLFHIHGLIAAVLASLGAGAGIVCTPGFNAMRFFPWLSEFAPTWYTAVPTMHQAILSRAGRNADIIAAAKLRLIRSSSASLPPQVMAELEEVFSAPVVEAYGMTEAAHQMACNPLPPLARKPGTVGLAAGPEIAILGPANDVLSVGAIGEVSIRGANVTAGYENNPKANAESFTDGWFRTGDQGKLDDDGYLTITGRIKEIINRGGEKVSPREVDEVLMDHPAVAQAVAFAIAHPKLGEEVGAAIVLNEGASADDRELRDYAASRLADFKVPRKIVIVDEIPKGPTGKLQRIGLAKTLGLEGDEENAA